MPYHISNEHNAHNTHESRPVVHHPSSAPTHHPKFPLPTNQIPFIQEDLGTDSEITHSSYPSILALKLSFTPQASNDAVSILSPPSPKPADAIPPHDHHDHHHGNDRHKRDHHDNDHDHGHDHGHNHSTNDNVDDEKETTSNRNGEHEMEMSRDSHSFYQNHHDPHDHHNGHEHHNHNHRDHHNDRHNDHHGAEVSREHSPHPTHSKRKRRSRSLSPRGSGSVSTITRTLPTIRTVHKFSNQTAKFSKGRSSGITLQLIPVDSNLTADQNSIEFPEQNGLPNGLQNGLQNGLLQNVPPIRSNHRNAGTAELSSLLDHEDAFDPPQPSLHFSTVGTPTGLNMSKTTMLQSVVEEASECTPSVEHRDQRDHLQNLQNHHDHRTTPKFENHQIHRNHHEISGLEVPNAMYKMHSAGSAEYHQYKRRREEFNKMIRHKDRMMSHHQSVNMSPTSDTDRLGLLGGTHHSDTDPQVDSNGNSLVNSLGNSHGNSLIKSHGNTMSSSNPMSSSNLMSSSNPHSSNGLSSSLQITANKRARNRQKHWKQSLEIRRSRPSSRSRMRRHQLVGSHRSGRGRSRSGHHQHPHKLYRNGKLVNGASQSRRSKSPHPRSRGKSPYWAPSKTNKSLESTLSSRSRHRSWDGQMDHEEMRRIRYELSPDPGGLIQIMGSETSSMTTIDTETSNSNLTPTVPTADSDDVIRIAMDRSFSAIHPQRFHHHRLQRIAPLQHHRHGYHRGKTRNIVEHKELKEPPKVPQRRNVTIIRRSPSVNPTGKKTSPHTKPSPNTKSNQMLRAHSAMERSTIPTVFHSGSGTTTLTAAITGSGITTTSDLEASAGAVGAYRHQAPPSNTSVSPPTGNALWEMDRDKLFVDPKYMVMC